MSFGAELVELAAAGGGADMVDVEEELRCERVDHRLKCLTRVLAWLPTYRDVLLINQKSITTQDDFLLPTKLVCASQVEDIDRGTCALSSEACITS